MNMCLLEVAMCEKCRSSHFQSEGEGSKKFQDWGVKKILELGGTFAGGGGQYPISFSKKQTQEGEGQEVNG